MDFKAFWDKHKLTIAIAVAMFLLGGILASTADAQECVPDVGDGPVDQQKSAVKKPGDTATISWILPEFLADCTPIADDPTYTLTSVQLYVSVNAPVVRGLPPIELPPTQTSVDLTVQANDGTTGDRTKRVYYAVQSCNEFGCGDLSGQPWVLVGGPPGRSEASAR